MGGLAFYINELNSLACLVLLVLACIAPLRFQLQVSTLMTFCVWTAMNLLMDVLTPSLFTFFTKDSELKFLWYPLWVFFNLTTMMTLYHLHGKFELQSNNFSRLVMLTLLLLSTLQCIRFIGRFALDWEWTLMLYKYGVLAMNIGPSIAFGFIFVGVILSGGGNKGKSGK